MALLCLGHSGSQPPVLSCLRLKLLSSAPQAGAGLAGLRADPEPCRAFVSEHLLDSFLLLLNQGCKAAAHAQP